MLVFGADMFSQESVGISCITAACGRPLVSLRAMCTRLEETPRFEDVSMWSPGLLNSAIGSLLHGLPSLGKRSLANGCRWTAADCAQEGRSCLERSSSATAAGLNLSLTHTHILHFVFLVAGENMCTCFLLVTAQVRRWE